MRIKYLCGGLLLCLLLLVLGCSGANRPLRLATSPTGAQVWVDGQPQGQTPLTLTLPTTARQISITAPNYLTLTYAIPEAALPAALDLRLFPAAVQLGHGTLTADWQWAVQGAGTKIYNTQTGTSVGCVNAAERPFQLALAPDGSWVACGAYASAAADPTLWLAPLADLQQRTPILPGYQVRTPRTHWWYVAPDSQWLAVSDAELTLVSIANPALTQTFTGTAPHWSGDGRYMVLTLLDGSAQHHQLLLYAQITDTWQRQPTALPKARALALDATGHYLWYSDDIAVGAETVTLTTWDLQADKAVNTFTPPLSAVEFHHILPAPTGSLFAVSGSGGSGGEDFAPTTAQNYLWLGDLATGQYQVWQTAAAERFTPLYWLADQQHLAVLVQATDRTATVRLIPLPTPAP